MQLHVIITMIMLVFVIGTFIEIRTRKDPAIMVSSLQKELQSNMEKLTIAINYAGKEINDILKNIQIIQNALNAENESNANLEKQLTSLLDLTNLFLTQVQNLQTQIEESPKKSCCLTKGVKSKSETKKKDKEDLKKDDNETTATV